MDTVHGILTFMKRLTGLCLQSLNDRFVALAKPDTTSLLLGTLIDLSRSKPQLVAENALLRQQLIIVRRQVKRPVCTKTDRMLLVLLARMVGTWKQALVIIQEDDAAALASPGFQALVEIQVEGSFSQAKDIPGDYLLDSGDGKGQSTVGSRADPGRIAQGGHPRLQAHHSEVHESCAHHQATRTDVEHVLTHARPADLGLQLSPRRLPSSSVRSSSSSTPSCTPAK